MNIKKTNIHIFIPNQFKYFPFIQRYIQIIRIHVIFILDFMKLS